MILLCLQEVQIYWQTRIYWFKVLMREWFLSWLIIILLTYSIYFSYAIFLTDYKIILKIAGGVKQLTSPTSGSKLFHARERCAVRHSCQMLYFFQNNVVLQFFNGIVCWYYHLQWICGYVHVYKIIKQLFHACSGNSQNYCPSVLEMTWELLPLASGNSSQVISSTSGQ